MKEHYKNRAGAAVPGRKEKEMTVQRIFEETGLIDDNTIICMREGFFRVISKGNWYQDNILKYENREVESFTWIDDNKIYIDLKEG